MEYTLSNHGYRKGLTSTEYVLNVIDELLGSGENVFIEKYLEVSKKVLDERPVNAASQNILRSVGEYLVEKGVKGIHEYLYGLRDSILKACEESALIAGHRVVDGDVLMTISNGLCIRRMFKHLVDNGVDYSVYVLESRPGMEGLDLVDYLDKLGVKTRLIVDSAARFFMKDVKKVFIGVEAIAVNGAVVGKVGTSILCLVAHEARVRVFALAPLYKFSFETIHGELLELPEGDWKWLMDEEVRKTLPDEYRVRVPLFDVTPPYMVDGIATEYGLFAPQAIPALLRELYRSFPPTTSSLEEIVERVERVYRG